MIKRKNFASNKCIFQKVMEEIDEYLSICIDFFNTVENPEDLCINDLLNYLEKNEEKNIPEKDGIEKKKIILDSLIKSEGEFLFSSLFMEFKEDISSFIYEGLKGKIIVFEGKDEMGKTTLINELKEKFSELNLEEKTTFISFPNNDGTDVWEVLDRYLKGEIKINEVILSNMFAYNRFKMKDFIESEIRENKILIMDRYIESGKVYDLSINTSVRRYKKKFKRRETKGIIICPYCFLYSNSEFHELFCNFNNTNNEREDIDFLMPVPYLTIFIEGESYVGNTILEEKIEGRFQEVFNGLKYKSVQEEGKMSNWIFDDIFFHIVPRSRNWRTNKKKLFEEIVKLQEEISWKSTKRGKWESRVSFNPKKNIFLLRLNTRNEINEKLKIIFDIFCHTYIKILFGEISKNITN